jgi:transcription antitermination factor NusG
MGHHISLSTSPLWFALSVRTRRERAVEAALLDKRYETFLPMMVESRQYDRKIRTAEVPCFPGYIFCRFDLQDRLAVLVTPNIYHIVGNGASLEPIPDSEMNAIKLMVTSNFRSTLMRHSSIVAGERVLIARGPLAGVEGELVRSGPSARVVVSISLLHRSISAEVDYEDLIPLNSMPPLITNYTAATA